MISRQYPSLANICLPGSNGVSCELLLAAIWRQWHPSLFDRSLIILVSDWPQPWGALLSLAETRPQLSPINQNPSAQTCLLVDSPETPVICEMCDLERSEGGMPRPDYWSPLVSNTWGLAMARNAALHQVNPSPALFPANFMRDTLELSAQW